MLALSIKPNSFNEYKIAQGYVNKNFVDLLEIRGETLSENLNRKILSNNFKNLIFTLKHYDSNFSLTEVLELYKLGIRSNVKIIDIDIAFGEKLVKDITAVKSKTKIILSYHNFKETPTLNKLKKLLLHLKSFQTEFIKIITKSNSILDNYKIFQLLNFAKTKNINLIAHCMGKSGKVSRIIGRKFGSKLIYACLENKQTADGQFDINTLSEYFQIKKMNKDTKIFGIIGNPLKQSKSWIYHNFNYKIQKLNNVYLNFECDESEKFLRLYKNILCGLSITIPFKEKITLGSYYKDILVTETGSANTLIFKNNKGCLYNTDNIGFDNLIYNDIRIKNKNVLVIGAGGSSKSIIHRLKKYNDRIYLANRSSKSLKKILTELQIYKYDKSKKYDVIINTTPNDNNFMHKLVDEVLQNSKIKLIIDIALHNFETKLIKKAKKQKIPFINGYKFFISQAEEQYKLMTGRKPDKKLSKEFLMKNYNKSF